MKMKKFSYFISDFGQASKPTMDMSIYQSDYSCGCGKRHWFPGYGSIICQGFMKIMMACPENNRIINEIKIKTFLIFKFKGLDTLSYTIIENREDEIMMYSIYNAVGK